MARDPATNDWGRAFERGLIAWNNVAGAWPMFTWEVQADLLVSTQGNGRNEVGVVRTAEIDGALGVHELHSDNNISYTATRLVRRPEGACP